MVIILIVEAIITFIIVAALFYVSPGVLGSIKLAAPTVYATGGVGVPAGAAVDASLNASAVQIGTTVAGGLNLSSITMIMMGIAIMIGGFMLVRGGNQ